MAVQAGLTEEETGITSKALEAHYLAGGKVPLVIRAMIAAAKAKTIHLTFEQARAIHPAGRTCWKRCRRVFIPKVIDLPAQSARPTISTRWPKTGFN